MQRYRLAVVSKSTAVMALRTRAGAAALLLGCGGLAIVWHASLHGYFVTDDAFISFRYSERLVGGHGLTWTGEERVEGYSNLLWVLLCALLHLFGADLVASARALGMLATLAIFGALIAACKPRTPREYLAPAIGIAFLASSDAFGVWAMGGLEGPLVCALLVWGCIALVNTCESASRSWMRVAALCLGLLCWTRPDSALWPIVMALALLVGNWRDRRRVVATVLLAVVLFTGAQLAFRFMYYADVLPNTAYAKVAFAWKRVDQGLEYLKASLDVLAAVWLSFLLLAVASIRRRVPRAWLAVVVLPALVWTVYVVFIGGDIFPAWRQFVPVVALSALAATLVCRGNPKKPAWQLGLCLVALVLVGTRLDPKNWAAQERWQWDGRPVGELLQSGFGEQRPLIAVDAAGTIPFYSKLPSLDMLGLSDRYLAHNRPKHIGTGTLGHELGDPRYYLERAPDVFCFGVPPCTHPAKFGAQREMVATSEFQQGYSPLRFAVPDQGRMLVSELWVRRDGAIGIVRTMNEVRVPAYFFAVSPGAIAHFSNGHFRTHLSVPAEVATPPVELRAGSWVLSLPVSLVQGGELLVRSLPPASRTLASAVGRLEKPISFLLPPGVRIVAA